MTIGKPPQVLTFNTWEKLMEYVSQPPKSWLGRKHGSSSNTSPEKQHAVRGLACLQVGDLQKLGLTWRSTDRGVKGGGGGGGGGRSAGFPNSICSVFHLSGIPPDTRKWAAINGDHQGSPGIEMAGDLPRNKAVHE